MRSRYIIENVLFTIDLFDQSQNQQKQYQSEETYYQIINRNIKKKFIDEQSLINHIIENNIHPNKVDSKYGIRRLTNNNLFEFVQFFVNQYSIPIDPIYNAKSLFALFDLAKNNFFPEHSKIVIIHTGGLQGITGFCKRYNLDTKLFGI